jgi:hypothetical protein
MPNEPDARALQRELTGAGYALEVEARDGLAIVRPTAEAPEGLTEEDRRRIQELARRHGFTHAAVEILPS